MSNVQFSLHEAGLARKCYEWFLNYSDVRQGCGPFLNEGVQLVQVDRFYQVMMETYLAAFADILFHSETSESNSERRFRNELLDQIYSTPIG